MPIIIILTILMIVGVIVTTIMTRKRTQELFAYVAEKHPEEYQRLAKSGTTGQYTADFLRSDNDLEDPELGRLKKRARVASKAGMAPFLILLVALVALYVFSSILGFINQP